MAFHILIIHLLSFHIKVDSCMRIYLFMIYLLQIREAGFDILEQMERIFAQAEVKELYSNMKDEVKLLDSSAI